MEKALAKLYGSYEAIARGACADGLQRYRVEKLFLKKKIIFLLNVYVK